MPIRFRDLLCLLSVAIAGAFLAAAAVAAPGPATQSHAVVPRPIAAASWHGRPIRHRDQAGPALAAATHVSQEPVLRFGAGYAQPGGSRRVMEVQRLLRAIGYRPGPVDGMFGPLTRASVQWFQIKHGLRPTGAVDPVALALLRTRARGEMPLTVHPAPPLMSAPAEAPARPASRPAAPDHSSPASARRVGALAAAAAVLLAILTIPLLARRRRRAARPQAAKPEPSPPPVPVQASVTAVPDMHVLGYASGRNRGESRRQAQTIEQACAEHGWALAQIVTERRTSAADRRRRPGLRFALQQLERGAGTRLVTARLRDVGRTRRELAALLGWCAHTGIELVALDVGLDTSTPAGRRAARELVQPAKRLRNARTRVRSGFTRARRAAERTLAPSSSP